MAFSVLNFDALTTAKGHARSVLAGFTTGQKVMTVLAASTLVIGGFYFMNLESKPNYQPLFTNLQASDSGAVTAQLTTAHVPYQLSNGGATILVPAADVDKERVTLAEQGLPNSGTVGFSNLEKSGITTSQFVQQVEYQQALEGQLEQTIESIQGVQSAQVSLVVPQQSDFAIGSQPTTTASILVDLQDGVTLSSGQVQAIVHLAASATPSLTAANVTVVDDHGDVLSTAGATSATTGGTSAQETAYDNQLSTSIEALLDRVVGVGNSAVQVHAVLNLDQSTTTTKGLETNAKGQPLVAQINRTTSKETYTGSGTPPSGVLGTGTAPTTSTGNGQYNSTSNQVTNAVGQVTQTVNQAPGQVETTSVAVLLNSSKMTTVSKSQVQALVAAAAGLNNAKGDHLVVTSMPFAAPAVIPAVSSGAQTRLLEHGVEALVLVLIIVGMLFLALRATRRPSYDEVPVSEFTPLTSRMMALEDEFSVKELPGVPQPPVLAAAPEAVIAQVNHYIEQRPAEVARLLRLWADERSSEPA